MNNIFKVMTDEHLANAISKQLTQKSVHTVRLIDVLPTGTPDPEVLEYCHIHGFSLITLDERMRGHAETRHMDDKEHAGVFIGTNRLQGDKGIGTIVNFIAFYDEAIKSGAASLVDDVYNQVIYID